jgi:uridine kinase
MFNLQASFAITSFIRLKRDISERGRDLIGVLQQYNTFVKPVSSNT